MRAMEYTPVECRCEPMGVWDMFRRCLIHGTQIEPTKKLSDAECAAEYWRARHTALCHDGGDPGWSNAIRRAVTWHRFATQPHASEVEA